MKLLLPLAAFLSLAGCQIEISEAPPDTRESQPTFIQPPDPLAPDLAVANLYQPRNGMEVSSRVSFLFDVLDLPHGMLLLFDSPPALDEQGHFQGGLAGCRGIALSTAGHRWDGRLELTASPDRRGMHGCRDSRSDPVIADSPLTTASLEPGATYWWVVVGYDSRLQPLATSPVGRFLWKGP